MKKDDRESLKGHVYGSWTVLERARPTTSRRSEHVYWTCECECGSVRDVRGSALRTGASLQCSPCGSRAALAARYGTH